MDPPPVWLMRQAGRYLPEYRALRAKARDFLDFCFTPDLAVEATLQPLRRFDLDAAIVFSDILTIPHTMGRTVTFVEGEGPRLSPITEMGEVQALAPDQVPQRLEPVYETIERVAGQLDEKTALIGFAGGPWTVAAYMLEGGGSSRDFVAARKIAYGRADLLSALMDRLVPATIGHLQDQIRAGAEVVQIFESWSGILADPMFDQWVVEPVAAIVSAVKRSHPDVPVIGFPRGAGQRYARFLEATGIDAVGLDSTVTVGQAQALQKSRCVQGNVDPISLLVGGDRLREDVLRILRGLASGPHVFNLGHGVLPETPPDHVGMLIDLIHTQPSQDIGGKAQTREAD